MTQISTILSEPYPLFSCLSLAGEPPLLRNLFLEVVLRTHLTKLFDRLLPLKGIGTRVGKH